MLLTRNAMTALPSSCRSIAISTSSA